MEEVFLFDDPQTLLHTPSLDDIPNFHVAVSPPPLQPGEILCSQCTSLAKYKGYKLCDKHYKQLRKVCIVFIDDDDSKEKASVLSPQESPKKKRMIQAGIFLCFVTTS